MLCFALQESGKGAPSIRIKVAGLESVLGGATPCIWQTTNGCPGWGGGCEAWLCGIPPHEFRPDDESCGLNLEERQSGVGIPPTVYQCVNSAAGLTECGFPSPVNCPGIEKCNTFCSGGTPIGQNQAGEEGHCTVLLMGLDTQTSQGASGDYCIGA